MCNEFSSKVYIGNEKKNIGLKILGLILAIIILGCVLIKVIVGDFQYSDISGILFVLLIIGLSKNRMMPRPQYGFGHCILNFDEELMMVTYPNINGGKKIGCFKETTVIRYEDIESIEYGVALECFRIVARCNRHREYLNSKVTYPEVLSTTDEESEVFVYVLDEGEQKSVLRNIQKNTGFIVRVLEE